jgi:hypothetical protein
MPRLVAATLTFCNLGQFHGHQGHVVDARHPGTVLRLASLSR